MVAVCRVAETAKAQAAVEDEARRMQEITDLPDRDLLIVAKLTMLEAVSQLAAFEERDEQLAKQLEASRPKTMRWRSQAVSRRRLPSNILLSGSEDAPKIDTDSLLADVAIITGKSLAELEEMSSGDLDPAASATASELLHLRLSRQVSLLVRPVAPGFVYFGGCMQTIHSASYRGAERRPPERPGRRLGRT